MKHLINIYGLAPAAMILLAVASAPPAAAGQASEPLANGDLLVDDFESREPGALPDWRYLVGKSLVPLADEHMRPRERFYIHVDDDDNRVCRLYAEGEAVHIGLPNTGERLDWDFARHPGLSWDWRVLEAPANAREDNERFNDTPAAVYVIFRMEGFLFKRPRAIKYAYSATLPVDTVVSYGKLKVIVVSSGLEGYGEWQNISRDVVADYRAVFGGDPPSRPLSIRLWGDSDNTGSVAEADFDNIRLLAPAQ